MQAQIHVRGRRRASALRSGRFAVVSKLEAFDFGCTKVYIYLVCHSVRKYKDHLLININTLEILIFSDISVLLVHEFLKYLRLFLFLVLKIFKMDRLLINNRID